MARLLRIDSSPRAARSHTRRLTAAFVDMWRRHHPDDVVSNREVGLQPPPPVDENWIAAAFCAPGERTAAMRAALALSEEHVDELLGTDLLVIGVPMYNFGIPAALKAYIDQIVRIGRTFAFEPHDTAQPYKPLVHGKQAIVIVSSGDAGYRQGEPAANSTRWSRICAPCSATSAFYRSTSSTPATTNSAVTDSNNRSRRRSHASMSWPLRTFRFRRSL